MGIFSGIKRRKAEKALQLAIDEAKLNKNSSVDLFEVDENGNLLDYSSGLILV